MRQKSLLKLMLIWLIASLLVFSCKKSGDSSSDSSQDDVRALGIPVATGGGSDGDSDGDSDGENTVPTLDDPDDYTGLWSDAVSIDLTASDEDSDDLIFSCEDCPTGITIDIAGQLTWTPTGDDVGIHAVTVRVSDGTDTAEQEFTINLLPNGSGSSPAGEAIESTVSAIGLADVWDMCMSSAGEYLYTADYTDSVVLVFSRDVTTGAVNLVQTLTDLGSGTGTEIDGFSGATALVCLDTHVYVSAYNDSALHSFSVDSNDGSLTLIQSHDAAGSFGTTVAGMDAAGYLTGTPDGKNLFITSEANDAFFRFSRDEATGLLTFGEAFSNSGTYGTQLLGLEYTFYLSVSPDSKSLYVSGYSSNAIHVLSIDETDGHLTFVESHSHDGTFGNLRPGLQGAGMVKVSPDGNHAYVSAEVSKAVLSFSRDSGSGALTYIEAFDEIGALGTAEPGLLGPFYLVISGDGRSIYVTNWNGRMVEFGRDTGTGLLTSVGGYSNTGEGYGTELDNFSSPFAAVVSPDDRFLYVSSPADETVHLILRQ